MSDLGDALKDTAITVVGAAAGAAVKSFLDKNPDVEEKVAAGKDLLELALHLIPEGELHAYLRDDDARDAVIAFKLMQAMKNGAFGIK
jgi:hypothetical protein